MAPTFLWALLVAAAAVPAASAAADGANGVDRVLAAAPQAATLPTGEEARPSGPLAPGMAEFAAVPALLANGSGEYRAMSLAPGPLPLSSLFGWRSDPLGHGARFHAGVDVPAHAGAAVRAVRPGRVVFSGWAGGYGNLVVIDHGSGVHSRYGHLERALVAAGTPVGTGTEIGKVGSTGRSTGPHLHYEVRVRGTAVDPLRAAMRGFADQTRDLLGPDTDGPPVDVAPRWSWRGAEQGDTLPVPVMR